MLLNFQAVLEEKKKGVRGEDTNMSHGKRTAVVTETDAALVLRSSGDREDKESSGQETKHGAGWMQHVPTLNEQEKRLPSRRQA